MLPDKPKPAEKDDDARLWDMVSNARLLVLLAAGRRRSDLASDPQFRLAVERLIEIVGEAARKVSREGQRAHPHIPWQKIVQQRHVISHDYDDLDYHAIWRVVTIHIPALIPQLEAILPEPPADPLPETESQ
jgi:uncharacterized protein with HEPN domain